MGIFGGGSAKKRSGSEDVIDGPGTAKAITPSKDADAAAAAATAAATTPAAKKGVGFSEDDMAAAAAKIQAIKRGKQDRAKVSEEKDIAIKREEREKATVKIQAIAKGRKARTEIKAKSEGRPNPFKALWAYIVAIDLAAIVASLKEKGAQGPCAKCLAPKPAPAASSLLSSAIREKVNQLFKKMDTDGDGTVDEVEAINFFKSFAKLNARAMLNEVDMDRSGSATYEEMCDFWANVMSSGNYEEAELLEELDNILKGEGWTDFDDGRTT